MKTVLHTTTLFYYDGPQIFEARDSIGGHYVALLGGLHEGKDRYLVVGVAPERLRQFRAGRLDLRSLMVESGKDEWYLAATNDLSQPLVIEPQRARLVDSDFLPEDGFVLHDRPADEVTLREARERNRLVLEVSTDPPEAADDHRIRLNTLIGLLSRIQTMVKHAYKAALKELSDSDRNSIDETDAHLLDVVVPAAAGSFRILLEEARLPKQRLDLFHHSELTLALKRVDALFEHVSSPPQTLAILKENRGHLAGAYLKLLRFLVDNHTNLRYSWADPTFATPSHHEVSESEAGPLVEVLSRVANLGAESVVLLGNFIKFDRSTGSWGLRVEGKELLGKIKEGGPSLDGLIVGNRYKFSCIEEVAIIEGTGRESRTLYLNAHEPD